MKTGKEITTAPSWEDICISICDELGRTPTPREVIDFFADSLKRTAIISHKHPTQQNVALFFASATSATSDTVGDLMGDTFSKALRTVMKDMVPMIKSKKYDIDTMSDKELLSQKYCRFCKTKQPTIWCEKDTMELVDTELITKEYVSTHNMIVLCGGCHVPIDNIF